MKDAELRGGRSALLGFYYQLLGTGSKNPELYQTTRSALKEDAWHVILRLGIPEARSWLVDAMEEPNVGVAIQ